VSASEGWLAITQLPEKKHWKHTISDDSSIDNQSQETILILYGILIEQSNGVIITD
jgi:hypothetical protein